MKQIKFITVILFYLLNCSSKDVVEDKPVSKQVDIFPLSSWSAYQGIMKWKDAIKKCTGLGMRLPTMEELNTVYSTKVTESWGKDGTNYWSSTEASEDIVYYYNIINGVAGGTIKSSDLRVRCIH